MNDLLQYSTITVFHFFIYRRFIIWSYLCHWFVYSWRCAIWISSYNYNTLIEFTIQFTDWPAE